MSKAPRTVNLALVQMTTPGSIAANIEKAIDKVRQAAKAGAHIVCLQELFNAPYPCQSEDHDRFAWAEPIPGPTSNAMSQVAKECSVVVTGSVFERRAHGLYHNTALVFDTDGKQVGFYRKMHIPDDPHYYEKFISPQGILDLQSQKQSTRCSVSVSAGTNGTPKPHAFLHCEVLRYSSTQPPSDGLPKTKIPLVKAKTNLGKP